MQVAQLTFRFTPAADADAAIHAIHELLGAWRSNGQLLGREFPVAAQADQYQAFVMLPEPNALDGVHANKWVKRARELLNEMGLEELQQAWIGPDPDGNPGCNCKNRGSLILYTTYLSLESCLRCGDCFGTVPLYQVPPTYDDSEYYDVKCWESDYQACDTLQMNCQTGERFGLRELTRVDSSLSRRGREICRRIEAGTTLPTFYYLLRYHGLRDSLERQRPCPSCGGAWRLNDRLHEMFDFQCEPCRLVSNLRMAS